MGDSMNLRMVRIVGGSLGAGIIASLISGSILGGAVASFLVAVLFQVVGDYLAKGGK